MPHFNLVVHCATILEYDDRPYSPPDPKRLTEACEQGDICLCGQELLVARLDMALTGLMQEFVDDFFLDDLFTNRCIAAVEILTAARVFLEPQELDRAAQEERVRLLMAEVKAALTEWSLLLPNARKQQTILYAAEEPATLL